MSSKVIHTYSCKKSSYSSSLAKDTSTKRKRPLQEQSNISSNDHHPPLKRFKAISKPKFKENKSLSSGKKPLTQLHFCIDQSIIRACPKCGLSYTKGAPDDESLHRRHCLRLQKGMEWGKEEERENEKAGTVEISNSLRLKDGKRGRIICCRADASGKTGSKLTSLLETINLSLSSPPLTSKILRNSKAYLFLLPPPAGSQREKIVGCVIAQRISAAMEVVPVCSTVPEKGAAHDGLVSVDPSMSLFCDPKLLPTPLGICRLFVPSSHRRLGIAFHLLSATAKTFIHGCPLDPRKGQVAFTQPTGDGNAVMTKWGGDKIRIYQE